MTNLTLKEQEEINKFQNEMLLVLDEKSKEKLSWLTDGVEVDYLIQETINQFSKVITSYYSEADKEIIKKHLIHMANFSMMIWNRLK